MGTKEQNKQIVQEGLDKRKTKRKQAIIDAEQEAITAQIIDIVNKNASSAETKKQKELTKRKKHNTNKKRIASLSKYNDRIIIRLYASVTVFALSILLYVTGLTALWLLVTSAILVSIYFAFNVYSLIRNAIKISELTQKEKQL